MTSLIKKCLIFSTWAKSNISCTWEVEGLENRAAVLAFSQVGKNIMYANILE